MYILSRLKDTVQIAPGAFSKETDVALRDELNRKYANKVLPGLGLCVAVFDIEDSSEGIVLHGDGCIYYKTIFRIVVFKPFVDELLLGKVGSSSKDGIRFSLGFFDDCWIPAHRLPTNCAFDPRRSEFFWCPNAEDNSPSEALDATPEDERYYIIAGETIRVRVIAEIFSDTTPKRPPKAAAPPSAPGQPPLPLPPPVVAAGPPPYRLECSIQEQGLGLLDWWRGSGEEQEDMEVAS